MLLWVGPARCRKAIEHEKPNEDDFRHPFKPCIGLGPGHLVSSPRAIPNSRGGEKHDEGHNDGTLPGNEGTETASEGGHQSSGRSTHGATRRDKPRAGGQEDGPDGRRPHTYGGAADRHGCAKGPDG